MYDRTTYDGAPYDGREGPRFYLSTWVGDHFQKMLPRLCDLNRITINEDGSFDGPPELAKYLYSLSLEYQQVDDAVAMLIVYRMLNVAKGNTLDTYGKIVGISRETYGTPGDDRFRFMIAVRILANASDGTYPKLYELARAIVEGEDYCWIDQYNPYSLVVTTDGTVFNEAVYYNLMADAVQDIADFSLIVAVSDDEYPFAFPDLYYLARQAAAGGAINRLRVLKTQFSPAISAGDFANGQIAVSDGTAQADIRTIDGTGAVDAGLHWDFTVTVNFTGIPDATTFFNIFPEEGGAMMVDEGSYLDLTASGGTNNSIKIPQASFVPAILAGDLANAQVTISDGTAAEDIRTIDATGAVADAGDWVFTVTEDFTAIPDGTSVACLLSGGGVLGKVIHA